MEESHPYVSVVRKQACRPTCLFDPAGCLAYSWLSVVSIAFCYNICTIRFLQGQYGNQSVSGCYRFAFAEINKATACYWLSLDYSADAIYLLDLLLGFRTAFFQDGVLQTNPRAIRTHFINTSTFYLDCLCLLPLDILYLSFHYCSIVRAIRLVKVYKFMRFIDVTERHTNHPNSFRVLLVVLCVLLTCHWNACFLYTTTLHWTQQDGTSVPRLLLPYNVTETPSSLTVYLRAFSLSCNCLLLFSNPKVTLFDVNGSDRTVSDMDAIVSVFEQMLGLFVHACVIAYVTNIISHVNSERKRFQSELDGVKLYMSIRRVPAYLQIKVIRWFDYLWRCKGLGANSSALDCLPDRLKAEIRIQVHLDTLKRVAIFHNTEPGFLCELVLRLKPMLFSPGDYVCRKGEVGKEMYVVDRGRLSVVNDDSQMVIATLMAGAYFGEISLLDVAVEGNRRTASVVSVGYSELLCLAKKDIWEVLQDYPQARERLEAIARRRLDDIRKASLAMVQRPKHSWPSNASQNCKRKKRTRAASVERYLTDANST